MGTQQILMIVLSVIVVGAAVAVGIQMFDTQATNAQRQALAADIQNFSGQVLAFYRTPTMMGGAGNKRTNINVGNLSPYLGFTGSGTDWSYTNANGVYSIGVAAGVVTITGKDTATNNKLEVSGVITPSTGDGAAETPNSPENAIAISFVK